MVVSYIWWPHGAPGSILEGSIFSIWALVVTGFLTLSVYDIRWYILPDKVILPLTVLGSILIGLIAIQQHSGDILVGSAIGAITIFGLFYTIYQVSGGKWIGGGDVKLAILLGLLAGGFMQALLLLFLASSLATGYAVILSLSGKKKLNRKLHIPFGPFLIAATVIVVLFGTDILDWYTHLVISV